MCDEAQVEQKLKSKLQNQIKNTCIHFCLLFYQMTFTYSESSIVASYVIPPACTYILSVCKDVAQIDHKLGFINFTKIV